MRIRQAVLSVVAALVIASAAAAGQSVTSTGEEQVGVEVTVYNNNLGLVKDTRTVGLPKGEGELRFMDVAAHIKPVTVHVKSTNRPQHFSVLEQNYEYDLISASKLLDKYVGKQIKIVSWNQFQDRKEVVEATLLSNNQGPIYKINEEIYLGHPGIQILPKLPDNLIAKPTLMWLYSSDTGEPHALELSYLTENLNWKADYVVVVNKDDTGADVSGWVTLDNQSGAQYKDARLKLVAGEVHRVQDALPAPPMKAGGVAVMGRAKTEQFQEKSFFEYHIYDLQRKTTLKDKQTKQVSLLEADSVKISKELLVYGIQGYFTQQFREKVPKQPVNVYIKFKNSKENRLGMPLPAGVMRLYKKDDDGSSQFIGEDHTQHTPKDEHVKLKIGEAFDVVAERLQTDFKQLTSRLYETEWEITLRNHKDHPVIVGIIEPLFGNWEVIAKTHSYTKLDAHTIQFDVKVGKDEEVKVKYRVKVGI